MQIGVAVFAVFAGQKQVFNLVYENECCEACKEVTRARLFPFSFIYFLSPIEIMTSVIECKCALFLFIVCVLLYFAKCDEE